jgi:hypothetical protein
MFYIKYPDFFYFHNIFYFIALLSFSLLFYKICKAIKYSNNKQKIQKIIERIEYDQYKSELCFGRFLNKYSTNNFENTMNLFYKYLNTNEFTKLSFDRSFTLAFEFPYNFYENFNQINKGICNCLKTNNSIKIIDFRWSKFGNNEMKDLTEVLKINTHITELNLSRTKINSEGFEYLNEVLKLNNCSIINIDLSGIFNNFGMDILSQGLKENNSIKVINLMNNNLEGQQIKYLRDALKLNNSITDINLGNNNITLYEGTKYLCEALKTNSSITKINLTQNNICSDVGELSQLLKTNKYISAMNLSSNRIGKTQFSLLLDGLKENTSIRNLDLSYNNLDFNNNAFLNIVFNQNSLITSINLSHNKIDDCNQFLETLGNYLKNNDSITKINISGYQFGLFPFYIFIEDLKQNKSIKDIMIDDDNIGREINHIIELLKVNTSIINIKSDNLFDLNSNNVFSDYISRNKKEQQAKRNNLLNLFSILSKL